MNESIGGSGLFYILIIIVSALLLLMLGFLSFSKAFKVKNNIINVIHENEVIDESVFSQIESDLLSVGYSSNKIKNCNETRVYQRGQNKLAEGKLKSFVTEISSDDVTASTYKTNFDYCVYKYTMNDGSYYYSVVTYVHMNIPLINEAMHLPVSGETKIFNRQYDD